MGLKKGGKYPQVSEGIRKSRGDNFWSEIGKIGGKNGTGHKFAHGKVDPAVAGRMKGKNNGNQTS